MKRGFILAILSFLAITGTANAALIIRGTDTLGNQLIYDSVQNITWYDHTFQNVDFHTFPGTFSAQFGATTLSGWRLPKHIGTPVTCWTTFNTCSATDELGFLWKDELGNPFGYLPSYNKGPFADLFLEVRWYWLEGGWYISNYAKDWGHVPSAWTLLVRDGDVAPQGGGGITSVAEPLGSGLLMFGLMLVGSISRIRRSHHSG